MNKNKEAEILKATIKALSPFTTRQLKAVDSDLDGYLSMYTVFENACDRHSIITKGQPRRLSQKPHQYAKKL